MVPATGKRFGLNLVSAVSPQGVLRFMVVDGRMTAVRFITFLKRLLHNQTQPIFLIVDQHSSHRAKVVQEFVGSTDGRLDLFWVRLFFIEDFSPYSWALLPADASPQWPFREGHQARQRVPASFRQPAEPRHGAEHLRSSPRQARSLLDIRAAFWYGAVGREADLRWL